MKKLFILYITLLLLQTSCSIDWKDENKVKIENLEKQVSELNKEKNDDFFKKKQECEKYKIEIEKKLWTKKLNIIFYSPLKKTCIYETEYREIDNFMKYEIYDYLENQRLFCSSLWTNCLPNIDIKDYNNKIKELKWE